MSPPARSEKKGVVETEKPNRKPNRLPDHDYSTPGAYFVTICAAGRKPIFSRVVSGGNGINVGEGLAPPALALMPCGHIIEDEIRAVETRYPSIRVERYVIMPDHVHVLFSVSERAGGASPSPTITDAVRVIKSVSAVRCRKTLGMKEIWQRSFYDHVVRNEADYREIAEYIDTNPARWAEKYGVNDP